MRRMIGNAIYLAGHFPAVAILAFLFPLGKESTQAPNSTKFLPCFSVYQVPKMEESYLYKLYGYGLGKGKPMENPPPTIALEILEGSEPPFLVPEHVGERMV